MCIFFVICVTVLCEQSSSQRYPTRLFVPVVFMHNIIFPAISWFCWIYVLPKITYVTLSFALPERVLENSEWFKRSYYMGKEQFHWRPFVISLTILQTTTKILMIKFTTSIANANLTLAFCGNASLTVCHWPTIMVTAFAMFPLEQVSQSNSHLQQ